MLSLLPTQKRHIEAIGMSAELSVWDPTKQRLDLQTLKMYLLVCILKTTDVIK